MNSEPVVLLREATDEKDLELMMAWRSDSETYRGFYSQEKPLTWEEHLDWFRSRNKDWRTFVIIYDGRKVGVVTVGQLDYWEPESGIYIGEKTLRGKGVGKKALKLAIAWLRERNYRYTRTTIKDDNVNSIKLYHSLGFLRIGEAREGESLYRLKLT